MEERISETLKGLGKETKPEEALEILRKLNEYLTNLTDYSKIDQLTAAIFHSEEDGLLAYFQSHYGIKGHEKAKKEGLKVLQILLENPAFRGTIAPVCFRIFKIVRTMYQSQTESSAAQQEALECVVRILENFRERILKGREYEEDYELPKLYMHLLVNSEKTCYTPSVRGEIFRCLGVVASFGGESFLGEELQFMQLLNLYAYTVKVQVESIHQKMEASILQGCIKGLDKFLQAFRDKILKDNVQIKQFYGNLEQIVDPKCSIENDEQTVKLKRREFQRSGLEFVAHHADYFSEGLFENHQYWYTVLLTWAKSNNLDDSKAGTRAVMKFLETVCAYVKTIVTNSEYLKKIQAFNKFFAETFKAVMESQEKHRTELTIAVKGVGLLCDTCEDTALMEPLHRKLIEHIEAVIIELNMPVTSKYSGSHSLVQTYLEASGRMLFAMKIVTDDDKALFEKRLLIVENLCILLVTSYPDLSEKYQYFAPNAFLKVVHGLLTGHFSHCEPFVERVIHEGLTHIIASPTQVEADILVESYNQQNLGAKKGSNTKSVYNTLGLRTVKSYTKFWVGLMQNIEPDFKTSVDVIYNSVIDWILKTIGKLDLSLQFVEDDEDDEGISMADPIYNTKATVVKDFQLFVNAVDFLTDFVMQTSPHLFENWVEVFVIQTLDYIQVHSLVSGFYRIMALVFELTRKLGYFQAEGREEIFQRCSRFLDSLSIKLQEFRDDLLMAILDVWLAAPDEMIIRSYAPLGDTLQAVFRTGRSSFHLALRGIRAIERWFQIPEFPEEEMERLFNKLFPLWQDYFNAGADVTEGDTPEIDKDSKPKPKSRSKKQRFRSFVRTEMQDTTLGKLQLKIVGLIGSYGHLIDLDLDEKSKGFSTTGECLSYTIPFQDIKPGLFLDKFFPRLIELCDKSTDRQLRTSACEVFHNFVLYFLGQNTAPRSEAANSLCRRVFRSMLQLGSDTDVVVRQLFNPLALQTIHWCSKTNHHFGEIALHLIIDGIVQSEDPARRDFSSTCLQEYFSWCLKHGNQSQASSIIKFLVSLSQHAAPQYRQGSVLGFNSIYRIFREPDPGQSKQLYDQYTFQLLHSYVISLHLSAEFEESSLLIRTTKRAIGHLERIIIKKKENFCVPINQRVIPADVKGPTLRHLIDWLLRKSGETFGSCRRECFRLIHVLAPCIRGINSVENFLDSFEIEFGKESLIQIAEKGFAVQDFDRDFFSRIKALESSSEFYSFLKKSNYSVEMLFNEKTSKFVPQLQNFFKDLETLDDVPECPGVLEIVQHVSPLDQLLTNDLQAILIESSANLSAKLIEKNTSILDISETWKQLWHCCASSDILFEFGPKLKHIFRLSLTPANRDSLNRIKWLTKVAQSDFLKELYTAEEIRNYVQVCLDFVDTELFETPAAGSIKEKQLTTRAIATMKAVFDFTVSVDTNGEAVVEKIFDPTVILLYKSTNSSTKGDLYQKYFMEYLPFCPKIFEFSKLKDQVSMEKIGKLIQRLLTVVKNKKHLRKRFGGILVEKTIGIWTQLSLNCTNAVISGLISGMASLHMNLCRDSDQLANWWCGPGLMRDVNLNLRGKCQYIHFVGLFGLSKKKDIVSRVILTLQEVLENDLNSQLNWKEEESCVLKILHAVLTVYEETPGTLDLLKIVALIVARASILSNSEKGGCYTAAKNKLVKVASYLDYKDQFKMTDYLYGIVAGENPEFRRTLIVTKYLLLPVLASIGERATKDFFKKNINDIVEKTALEPKNTLDWHLKIIAFQLTEVLCLFKTTQGIFFTGPELNTVYLTRLGRASKSNDSKDCARDLMKNCTAFKLPKDVADDSTRKLMFQCNQAAFNVLHVGLRVMQSKLQAVLNIGVKLCTDKYNKAHWNNVIDCSVEYNFPAVLPEPGSTKSETTDDMSIIAKLSSNNRSTRKAALQTSSLAIDATNYDFTAAVTVENSKFYQKIFAGTNLTGGRSSAAQLEWSMVNEHPCMLSFVETIRNFDKKKAQSGNENVMKDLASAINDFVKNRTCHKNIKIFLVGAILNCKEIFQPHADILISSIVNALLPPQSCFGIDLNYFLKDILVMLMEWTDVAKPSSDQVSKILEFILPIIWHDRKDVFKHNLEILETMCSKWLTYDKEEIPVDFIANLMDQSESKVGLEVCKHILLAGFFPCHKEAKPGSLDLKKLFAYAGTAFSSTSKLTSSLGAQVAGLTLREIKKAGEVGLVNNFSSFLRKFIDKEKKRPEVFLRILKNIQDFFPPFLTPFKPTVLQLLTNQNLRSDALQLIPAILKNEAQNSGADQQKNCLENMYSDLNGRGVFTVPCKNDVEAEVAVEILEHLASCIDDEDKLLRLIEWADYAEKSQLQRDKEKLRTRFASLISQVYYKRVLPVGSALRTKVEKTFLRLYQDEDEGMKLIVSDFWERKLKSWRDSPKLILELMETLGDEGEAIPICISLIMKRCSLSPDFSQQIFMEGLGECVFQPYNVDTSWRMRHSTFQPLYAESLSSSQNFPNLPQTLKVAVMSQVQSTGRFGGMNLLRATLDNKLLYTPTAPGAHTNQTQESMETGNSFTSQGFYQDFNQPDTSEQEAPSGGSGGVLAHLRKRFYDRPPSQQNFYAIREIERQEAAAEKQVEAIRTKRSGVKLMRSYRIGELPDIMMKHSDFLTALSTMTKTDVEVGRSFLVRLFTALVNKLRSMENQDAEQFQELATKTFNNILKDFGARLNPQFAAAVIEISVVNSSAISIQPHFISICRNFELQPLAILKLENALECSRDAAVFKVPEPKRARLTGSGANIEADILLRIAELYKDLDDFDAVRNVFSMAGQACAETKELYDRGAQALYLESLCKFDEALELYGDLCVEETQDPNKFNEMRLQFWDSSVYKCLKQLSDWEGVFERTERYCQDAGLENVFEKTEYLDQVLPLQLTAAVQILIRDQSPADAEPDIVERARSFLELLREKEEIWESAIREFVDIPIISSVLQHEIGHTLSWLDKSLSKSVEDFRYFEKFSKPQKNEQLLKLQRASVLQDYLHWLKNSELDSLEFQTTKIITKWKHSGRPKFSCLLNSDIIVAQKDYSITSMLMHLEEKMLESKDHLCRELTLINFEQYLWLANLGISTGNYSVAIQTFKKAKEIGDSLEESFMAAWQKLYCRFLSTFTDAAGWEKMWASSWKNLRKLEDVDDESLNEVKSDLLKCLFHKLSEGPPACPENYRRIRTVLSVGSTSDLIQHTTALATDLAQTVVNSVSDSLESTSVGVHMKLYNLLKSVKSKMEENTEDTSSVDRIMLISLLQAMQAESMEALHLFPTTFPIVEKYPELSSTMLEQVQEIPSWMFLPWLDQIVVNCKHSRTLQPSLNFIIQKLMVDYPQAFQLQYTQLLKEGNKLSPVYALYSEALTAVTLPSSLFLEYFQPLRTAKEVEERMEKCKQRFNEVREKPHIYGNLHQTYVNKLIPTLETQLKKLREVNKPSDSEESQEMESEKDDSFAITLWNQIRYEGKQASDTLEGKAAGVPKTINLENLSPWLARFRSCAFEDYLEVPGLYSKFDKPDLIFHPKIVSFYPTVLLMPSITKPIRLTMICNNGKEVRFLVKKGDDLRQDKRIQQCFHVANEIFKVDPHCKARKLQMMTYSIIPCTTSFGLIEWVDNTVALKKLVLNSKPLEEKYYVQRQSFKDWIRSFTRQKYSTRQSRSEHETYHINAEVAGRDLVEKKFDEIAQILPNSLFRDHVVEGCSSFEDYFAIRERMIRSYATMCFVHWLLGIGDRHLDNSLISTENGEFLGIDFGRSFGTSLVRQPIPELVPFRLTPQIQNFLQPYGCNGLLKETMICVHRTVKKSAELLIAVADVFIKEPLTDWLKMRVREGDVAQVEDESQGLSSWDPIKILKSKLAGENPLTITVQQIQYMSEKLRPVYTKIVKDGRGALGIKAKMTDEEYVDMLIQLATDKNILARQYEGWSAWI